MKKNIVTLTMNPAIDTSAAVRQVVAERKLRCSSPRREPGGGGINVSRAIRILGGDSLALYPSGGPTGKLLQELLSSEGIDHRPLSVEPLTRENFTILEESSNRQFRFVTPGSKLRGKEWEEILRVIFQIKPPPFFLVVSGSLPPGVPEDFFARLAAKSAELDIRVIVDTSGAPLRQAARGGIFLLKPNLRELKELAGGEIQGEADQVKAARTLIDKKKSEVVVVSLGAAGALAIWGQNSLRFRAPAVPISSRVGAGDSMVAGIVLSLARGMELEEAVRFGVAAGAAAVMTPGTELCRRDDTERLYNALRKEKGRK